ncbi:hypothetical protein [Actinomadura violacea]|uniref:Uncharacterized protein n=1 Tax=Actinomadura violacea TaxID=2819934 RepID=A0ABS3S9Z1_9ACTN|nr:hypothetical protein [Actinomadura violacea]MBO2465383.1 hypothetical protein [Actinomadura violacea]
MDIDLDMIPLVRALWRLGLSTSGCCQDLGASIRCGPRSATGPGRRRHADFYAGQAWLKMSADDARTMLDLLVRVLPKTGERLNRWTRADAWDVFVYLVAEGESVVPSCWAQVHFPRIHLNEVTRALSMVTAAPLRSTAEEQPDAAAEHRRRC